MATLRTGGGKADFGFADVATGDKAALVGGVFARVAPYYDRMNDLMSGGAHRVWKSAAVLFGELRPGMHVLDLACGSGDMAARILPQVTPGGQVALADRSAPMLRSAHKRLGGRAETRFALCDGESLPFADCSFDRVFIAFGLRNITRRELALSEMRRVLRPGGMCIVLEFSPPRGVLAQCKRQGLLSVLPRIGRYCFNDEDNYRYLGESIVRFPPPEQVSGMMTQAGFARVQHADLAAGIVTAHRARRLS